MPYFDQKTQMWIAKVTYTEDGKKKSICRSAKTKGKAKEIEYRIKQTRKKDLSYDLLDLNLDSLFETYIDDMDKKYKRSTLELYRRQYEQHISPILGKKQVSELSVNDFREWRAWFLKKKKYSFKTKRMVYSSLHLLLVYGQRMFGAENCTPIELEKMGNFVADPNAIKKESFSPEHDFWTMREFQEFISVVKKHCLENTNPLKAEYIQWWSAYVIYMIMFNTGLRVGEADALEVCDYHEVAIGKPYIEVNKTLNQKLHTADGKLEWVVTAPKSDLSNRKVPVSAELEEVITEHIERLKRIEGFGKHTNLVGGIRGIPMTTIQKKFDACIQEAGVKHITIHGLRHSFITLLISNGVSDSVVAKLAGHTVPTLRKYYKHLYKENLDFAIDFLDKAAKVSNQVSNRDE